MMNHCGQIDGPLRSIACSPQLHSDSAISISDTIGRFEARPVADHNDVAAIVQVINCLVVHMTIKLWAIV
jgi:hypothetical protein